MSGPHGPRPDGAVGAAPGFSWAAVLHRHAHLAPDRTAIRFGDRTLTYGQLERRVVGAVEVLRSRGLAAGDRVAIFAGNAPEVLEVLAAVARLGALAVPVNFRLTEEELRFVLDDSGSSLVVTDDDREAVARAAAADRAVLSIGPTYDAALVDAGRGGTAHAPVVTPVAAEAPALIMYTSGTTGRPKGAVLSHLNLFAQTLTQVRSARLLEDDDVYLCASPLFHIAGIAGATPPLLLGNVLVLQPSTAFSAEEVVEVLEREAVTSAFLVPSQWQAVCDVPGLRDRRLRLHTLLWGASPCPRRTLQAMAEAFPGVGHVAGFGQTEMSPTTASLPGSMADEKMGTVGRAVPLVDFRVVDEDLRDVEPGDVGEIVYRGPTAMREYWHAPEATAEAFAGGWFHSGDLVRVDEDGYIVVVDRKKDMIVSGGENIYSAEVEAALEQHPDVLEVAVVGAPHERWVETPVAFVVAADPQCSPPPADLRAFLDGRLARYKHPTRYELVPQLPRNPTGKVLKVELRARLDEQARGA